MQPAVGLGGEGGAEAEGLRQGQVGAVEAGQDVFGAAPPADGPGRVADHDQLGVLALGEEDLFDDGIGVLGLVQQQEIGLNAGPGKSPDLEAVIVVEANGAVVRVLQVGPGFAGERHDVGGKFGVQVGIVQTAQAGYMVAGDGLVRGVAEAGDGAQGGVGQGALGDLAVADADGFWVRPRACPVCQAGRRSAFRRRMYRWPTAA